MKTSEIKQIIREEIKSILNESNIPSNIEKWIKQRGPETTRDVRTIGNWVKKLTGHGISGGTAIGKGYNTLVLDIKHQDAAVYYDTYEGTIKLYGKRVSGFQEFKKVLQAELAKSTIKESEIKNIINEKIDVVDWDEYMRPPHVILKMKDGRKMKVSKKNIPGGSKTYQMILMALDNMDQNPKHKIFIDRLVAAMETDLTKENIAESEIKKGSIVKPKIGPHKGLKHKVIHDFGNGKFNIQPIGLKPRYIKYRLGAAGAKEQDLELVETVISEGEYSNEKIAKGMKSKVKPNMTEKDVIALIPVEMKKQGYSDKQIKYYMRYDEDWISDVLGVLEHWKVKWK
ncbi:MAG: hypothetical protein H8E98_06155 [Bacteroidetes bacterium]|nr:hypothetical protein [Bacteroidota bacterium]